MSTLHSKGCLNILVWNSSSLRTYVFSLLCPRFQHLRVMTDSVCLRAMPSPITVICGDTGSRGSGDEAVEVAGSDCCGQGGILETWVGFGMMCKFQALCPAFAVSNEDLRGSTPEAAAQVVQWVSFADSDIVPPASTWVFPTLGIMHHNKQVCFGTRREARDRGGVSSCVLGIGNK